MRTARILPLIVLLELAAAPGTAAPPPKAPARARVASPAAKKPAAKKPVSAAARAVAVEIGAQAGGAIKAAYAARGFWPLWAEDGRIGPAADALIGMIDTARADGLNPAAYDLPALRAKREAARGGDPAAVAAAELALSRAFTDYVADVRRAPKVGMIWADPALKPRRLRPAEVLRAAALTTDFSGYVTAMGWMSPHYVRLRRLMADAPPADAARVRLNLDRARILPGPWVRHIVVDAASARLFWYAGGRQQGVMRVVAGTPETPTPMMAGMLRYAILNPYWNVPVELARKRVAPRVLGGATLAALRFEALSGWNADAVPVAQSEIDWAAVAAGRREVRLRQLPGAGNAMGRVKFMFPNTLGIYLHDTSDRALLTKPARHLSNGCVRLEDAPKLGRWLLGRPLAAYPRRAEQDVALAEPVPVYLTYFTATPTARGAGFLADVYARDGGAQARR